MTKLEQKRKQYNIPEIPYLPANKTVLVCRLPNETKTAGGLFIPGQAEEAKPMGVLLAAGLTAQEELRDHLVEIGDTVWFGRFAGWEKEVARDPEGKGFNIIQMRSEDILGSVDALERVGEYEIQDVEIDDKEMQLAYVKKTNKRKAAA